MPARLNNLGVAFLCLFENTGDVSDLLESISILQRAVRLTPDGHPDMASRLNNLGVSFRHRFERIGDVSDVSEAISVLQRAIQLTPNGHPDMPMWLSNLGNSFQRRFERTGLVRDLIEAISTQRRAVQLTPCGHSDLPMWLNNLGVSLQSRFEHQGDVSDLSEAISNKLRAVQLAPNGHPSMPVWLDNLGISFQKRFQRTGNISDVSEAISIQQRALQLTPHGHSDMPICLNNIGNSFQSRFERTGDVADLLEAISNKQKAVRLIPNDHSHMPSILNSLGNSLQSRFELTGNIADVSEAITIHQRAAQMTLDGHPDMPIRLNSLGNSFRSRFERTGDVVDLSEAISIQHQTVQLTRDDHPHMPSMLNDLGVSFQSRFERTGDVSDLLEAILNKQRAVQLTPNGHPDMPMWLNHLGSSLQSRFECTGDVSDISEAILIQQRAVQLTSDGHPNMSMLLNNIGNSFQSRFKSTGDVADLSEAISIKQQAVQINPDGHPHRPSMLNNLGVSFQSRFQRTGDVSDLSEAISVQRQAVELTPDGHPNMPMWLNHLGNLFESRFKCTGDFSDIHTAAMTFQKSATTFGRPFDRFRSAQRWAQLSMLHHLPHPLTAYAIAIDLVSEIASMDRTIKQRYTDLIDVSSSTRSAVSAAFILGDVKKAFEWLEQGRCLIWNQLNQLRSPVDHLRAHDEHLAQRFSNISSELEASGSRRGSGDLGKSASLAQKISLQDEAHLHIKLSREWSKLLKEIRNIPQFHNFLQPPQTSDLLKHLPPDGIVVLVNVDETRCDALALTSGSNAPIHICLNDFTYKEASKLRERLRLFLSSHRVRMREVDRGGRPVQRLDAERHSEIHLVLKALWLGVVRPILDGLTFSVSVPQLLIYHFVDIIFFKSTPPSDPARIWWCPTGPLAFLPLHAAGIYGRNGRSPPGSCVSDFTISSYAPTVSSLLQKLQGSNNIQQSASSKLLIISQPNTPGCPPIPETTKEMDCIWDAIGTSNGDSLRLEGESASVRRVQLEMETHGSIHFACHATQDLENPLKSGFYLHDGRLELSEIMKKNFTVRELAFLSACQTSTGDEKLSEEAVHLAAGMLAAGYRSVVATMWSIKDRYGPVVAESFYKDLMQRGKASGQPGIDSSGAAHALHHAIQGIRDTLGDTEEGLLTWVPYVHFGC